MKYIGFLTLLYTGITSIFSFKYFFILIDIVKKLKQGSISVGSIYNVTSEILCSETVVNTENVKPVSEHEGVVELTTLCIRAKLRGHLKVLVTKVLEETLRLALLMIKGKVKSLEIDLLTRKIGYRGPKSEFIFCKRATSGRFFCTAFKRDSEMYSSHRETGYWAKNKTTSFFYFLPVIYFFYINGF